MADRMLPPALEPPMPPCPLCKEEVEHDGDSFRCPTCKASWSDIGYEGNWEDDGPQCPSAPDGEPCVLTEGHKREHRDRYGDAWPGDPYRVWGYRSAGVTWPVSEARSEADALWLARLLSYEVVWRMSDERTWLRSERQPVAAAPVGEGQTT